MAGQLMDYTHTRTHVCTCTQCTPIHPHTGTHPTAHRHTFTHTFIHTHTTTRYWPWYYLMLHLTHYFIILILIVWAISSVLRLCLS